MIKVVARASATHDRRDFRGDRTIPYFRNWGTVMRGVARRAGRGSTQPSSLPWLAPFVDPNAPDELVEAITDGLTNGWHRKRNALMAYFDVAHFRSEWPNG